MKFLFTVRLFLIVVISFLFFPEISAQQGGYVDNTSVVQGDTLNFRISTSVSLFTLSIYKFDATVTWITDIGPITGGVQNVPGNAYVNGCGWNVTYSWNIPNTMTPGVYRAEFPIKDSTGNDATGGIIFIVRPNNPGTYSNILFICAENTWQAYNNFGGKSLYDFNSSGSTRAPEVSFQRPYEDPYGSGDFYNMEVDFILWLGKENINPEYVTNLDLDRNSNLLGNYKVVCVIGHSEYWTYDERKQVENYIDNGGKVAIFSGNTCWWKARLGNNGNTLVCYKDSTTDPLTGIEDSLVTVNWFDSPVNNPENKFTGVSFRNGGFVNYNSKLTPADGYGDYAVYNTQSWVFKGTGLKDGDEFGGTAAIVGYETDGAKFEWNDGIPISTWNPQLKDGTPSTFKVLGVSPALNYDTESFPYGHATMGYYFKPNGAYVFNAATTYWVRGLDSDSIVSRITLNVINKFLNNNFPPEIVSWTPAIADSITRNYDPEIKRSRDLLETPGTSRDLTLSAVDPFGASQVKYYWALDGNVESSKDTIYTFHNIESTAQHVKNVVSAYAYITGQDTVSISWNLFDYPLVISSQPTNAVKLNSNYSYQVKVFDYNRDSLNFQLVTHPSWLSINSSTGMVTGTAPSQGEDALVSINVIDGHNNSDTQTFTLHVSNTITNVKLNNNLPTTFSLFQNFPNPFNPSTTINYQIPKVGFVTLKVYDVLGREVALLVNEEKPAGSYRVNFDASSVKGELSSGIYFYRISVGNYSSVKKMVLLK
ncbi:MAG: N,N-dimethylformamidase beta subunit family domain-containing protein [Ignavibacteriaceae bacterium]